MRRGETQEGYALIGASRASHAAGNDRKRKTNHWAGLAAFFRSFPHSLTSTRVLKAWSSVRSQCMFSGRSSPPAQRGRMWSTCQPRQAPLTRPVVGQEFLARNARTCACSRASAAPVSPRKKQKHKRPRANRRGMCWFCGKGSNQNFWRSNSQRMLTTSGSAGRPLLRKIGSGLIQ